MVKYIEVIEAYNQGNLEFFQQIRKNGMFNCVIKDACFGGNLDLLKFLVQHFQANLNNILSGACLSGHMDIVQFAIDEGATHFNSGLTSACFGGHIEIVKLMIQKGATNLNDGLFRSTLYGNIVLSTLLINKGATNLIDGIRNACFAGSLELIEIIFKKLVNYTLNDLNACLDCASSYGHFEIVKLLILKGATDYNEALKWVCLNLNDEYVKIRCERVENQLERLKKGLEIKNIIYEHEEEYIKIIKLMIEYGANSKSCKELTSQIIVKTLNIGCNLNYFLHDERSFPIINLHNNVKQHLRMILSHNNDSDSLQVPTDVIDYCIVPYVNFTL